MAGTAVVGRSVADVARQHGDESWGWRRVLLVCVVFRALNALTLRTFFNPDEYWQSLEVAHRLAFGYGHLTWEWAAGLRGYTHPLLFAALYKCLATAGMDTQFAVSRAPLLMQALFAAVCDVHVYLISGDVFGQSVARYTLLCQLTSWFNFYCLPRTYANSMEATLTAAAIYHWGLHRPAAHSAGRKGQRLGLSLAAFSVVVRPACVLFWLLIGCSELLHAESRAAPGGRTGLLADAAAIACLAFVCSTAIDRIFYGRWVVVMWEFAKFNVLQGGSALYGSHPWHWNFTQGLPTVTASYLPLVFATLWSSGPGRRLAFLVALYVALMSIPSHKEFRFLLPALQVLMPLAGWSLCRMMCCPPSPKTAASASWWHWCRPTRVALVLVGVQVLMAAYFSLIHQRGTIAVMDWLSTQPLPSTSVDSPTSPTVLFLMPCHSTPFYSHLHRPARMRFLDCSPPGWAQAVTQLNSRLVELPASTPSHQERLLRVEDFHEAPALFLQTNLLSSQADSQQPEPLILVMFDAVTAQPGVAEVLTEAGYQLCAQFFHSHFAVDHNGLQSKVVVYASGTSASTADLRSGGEWEGCPETRTCPNP